MIRLALLSDIHGNPIALDAVLADIQAQGGVDAYWVLGDLVAIGYDPASVLARLETLPGARFVRGNTDRYTATGDRPWPTHEAVRADPQLLPRLVEIAHSFAWTQGYVTALGKLDWLATLPLEQRLVLPDGTRLLGVHAAPGQDVVSLPFYSDWNWSARATESCPPGASNRLEEAMALSNDWTAPAIGSTLMMRRARNAGCTVWPRRGGSRTAPTRSTG